MSVLNPDNKLASLRVDAQGRLMVTGSVGGGGGGGGAMRVQVIGESRALTEDDNYTYILLYNEAFDPIVLTVDPSLPEDFHVIVVPSDSGGDGYAVSGGATVNGGGAFSFTGDDIGYQTELRRMPNGTDLFGDDEFQVKSADSTLTPGFVEFTATNIVTAAVATERADFTIPQIDSRQAVLGQVSFAAGGTLENWQRFQMLECGGSVTVSLQAGRLAGCWFLITQPGASFDLTAEVGVLLNGVDGDTITFTSGTENIIMVVKLGDVVDDQYIAYAIG